MKFRLGNKVRIIVKDVYNITSFGSEGVITQVSGTNCRIKFYKLNNTAHINDEFWIPTEHIELIFKKLELSQFSEVF